MSKLFPALPIAAVLAVGATASSAHAALAPTWSSPLTVVEQPALTQTGGARIAQDAEGNQVAAWTSAVTYANAQSGPTYVSVASRPAGGAWSVPTTWALPQGTPYYPSISALELNVSATGWVAVSWVMQGRNFPPKAQFVTRTPAGVWTAPADVESPGVGPNPYGTSEAHVAVGPSGELFSSWSRVTVWNSSTGEAVTTEHRLQFRAAGAASFTDDAFATLTDRTIAPQFDGSGNAFALFFDRRGLTGHFRPAGGAWGPEEVLEGPVDNRLGEVQNLTWAFTTDGSVVAAWSRVVDGQTTIESARRSPAGAWSGPKTLSRWPAGAAPTRLQLKLTTGGTRAYLAITETTDTDTATAAGVDVFETDAAGAWTRAGSPGTTITVPASPAGSSDPYRDVSVAGDADGDLLTTWTTDSGTGGRSHAADGAWTIDPKFGLPDQAGARNFGALLDSSGHATVLYGVGKQIRSTAATIAVPTPTPSPTPTPTPTPSPTAAPTPTPAPVTKPVVKADADLVLIPPFLATLPATKCPNVATVSVNGRRVASLPTTATLYGTCSVRGLVPAGAKVGTTVLVSVTGTGTWPVFAFRKVIAG